MAPLLPHALLCVSLLAPQPGELARTSEEIEKLSAKVSPAVVKILVSGYGLEEEEDRGRAAIGRQTVVGSGVIVDSNGYIVTNAHVVAGAEQIRVSIPQKGRDTGLPGPPRVLKARLMGADKTTDLAVLKVEAAGLPTLPIGDDRKLRQGQVVLAFGSPEGLDDTVTMGVVSSPMRQLSPDQAAVYIQTDAAINPGNSGGPLVDIAGDMVGVNAFILSESGGNEGLGFAIPAATVRFVYEEILTHGHVHRRDVGASFQTITPALAAGLRLPQSAGVVVSDVAPDGPAAKAGLRVQDVLLTLDGEPVTGLPMVQAVLYRKPHGGAIALEIRRGAAKAALSIPVQEQPQSDLDDLVRLADPEKSLVRRLGVLCLTITPKLRDALAELRTLAGVLVAAKAAGGAEDEGLAPGDVIHAVNGVPVESVEALRAVIDKLKRGDAIALQVEREEQLLFVAFEIE